jgi:hypothetical protein
MMSGPLKTPTLTHFHRDGAGQARVRGLDPGRQILLALA